MAGPPKGRSRDPLCGMQLSTSGHRNVSKDGMSDSKGIDHDGKGSGSLFVAGMSPCEPYFE